MKVNNKKGNMLYQNHLPNLDLQVCSFYLRNGLLVDFYFPTDPEDRARIIYFLQSLGY